jgi:hypothetical protein
MILRRLTANLRAQNWTAIAIDFVIVVLGVFLGIQASNWNQQRVERAATRQMLAQLVPELRSQLEFFDSAPPYFAASRVYADQAFAGWRHDPRVSDSQFVIAAYQASQITAISINADSWSLTFGGEQLRNIEDPKIRRNLELVMTSDYSPVGFAAVATAYREQVRHVIPIETQDRIRQQCGDRNVRGKEGAFNLVLSPNCSLKLDPVLAARTAARLRARADLVGELDWHLAAIATFLTNAQILATPIRQLEHGLSASA